MILREEATSVLAGFHVRPLSKSNWNFEMLVFQEGAKPEYPEKNPLEQTRTNLTTNSTYLWHWAGIEPGPQWKEASTLTKKKICTNHNHARLARSSTVHNHNDKSK